MVLKWGKKPKKVFFNSICFLERVLIQDLCLSFIIIVMARCMLDIFLHGFPEDFCDLG